MNDEEKKIKKLNMKIIDKEDIKEEMKQAMLEVN